MKVVNIGFVLTCVVALPSFASEAAKALAISYVQNSIAAMGGTELLNSVRTLRIESRGHYYVLDESERFDGPWSVAYDHDIAIRDYPHEALRVDTERWFFVSSDVQRTSLTVAGNTAQITRNGKTFPASIYLGEPDNAKESLAFVPERILPAALASSDLNAQADVSLHGVRYHVVSLTYTGLPTRLYLNADSSLLGVVEWTNSYPDSIFWKLWGGVANRVEFTVYSLLPGGLRLPLQRDYQRNGQPYHSESIFAVEVNPVVPPETFAIDPHVAAEVVRRQVSGSAMPRLGKPVPLIEGNDSLTQYVGEFNCAIVQQNDGLVIIEAPVDSEHTKEVIADAGHRYPHLPIKAVISTSGAWAHVGGIPEMIVRGIPVYATDVNRAMLTRLLNATSAQFAQRKTRSTSMFRWVSQRTTIGSGPNRLEIYPVRNAGGEGSLMLYFPAHKLLYSSDLLQPMSNGTFFWPEYLREMSDAVRRENLIVDNFFGMHAPVTPWRSVAQFLGNVQQRPL